MYDSNFATPFKESSPEKIVSPYGLSKKMGEEYVRIISNLNGSNWSSLALSNCYGSVADNPKGVIYSFYKNNIEGMQSVINGIDVTRDFIHVNDVVLAIDAALKTPTNRRVNISSNTEISLIDLHSKIANLMSTAINPIFASKREGDVVKSRLDNSLAFNLLNWKPKIDIDLGLASAILGKTHEN